MAPWIRGHPVRPTVVETPVHLSDPRLEKRAARSDWCWPSILMAKCDAAMNVSQLCALHAMLKETSGGSSETELNELAVTPIGEPSWLTQVTIVTPVAKCPNARRRSQTSVACAIEPSK